MHRACALARLDTTTPDEAVSETRVTCIGLFSNNYLSAATHYVLAVYLPYCPFIGAISVKTGSASLHFRRVVGSNSVTLSHGFTRVCLCHHLWDVLYLSFICETNNDALLWIIVLQYFSAQVFLVCKMSRSSLVNCGFV